jgi:hypothetical protein
MAASPKSPLNSKKARIAPAEAIPDGARSPKRNTDTGRLAPKTKNTKPAKNNVRGRMPERSESVSGDETDKRTLVSRQGPTK